MSVSQMGGNENWRPSMIRSAGRAGAASSGLAQRPRTQSTSASKPGVLRSSPKDGAIPVSAKALQKRVDKMCAELERNLQVPIGTFQSALGKMPIQESNDLRARIFHLSQLASRLAQRVPARAVSKG
ncbi:hypothetical protein K8Q93_03595 [Candidatus Parcubacteria bacterium]|nr:hypothetical protein [Candidatus Parcubacteria bacterium]